MARNLHLWTPKEDEVLIECLLKFVEEEGSLMARNEFKPYLFKKIEKLMEDEVDGCGIKAMPDIVSRLNKLRQDWIMIYEMIHDTHNLGFQWDAEEKRIIAEENVWNDYIKVNKKVEKLRGKSFSHFDALNMVFNNGKIVEEDPHIYNEVVNEFEMLHDEVLKVEGITDEKRQQAYVKLVRDDEFRVIFSHLSLDAKKELVINLK